MTVSIYDIAKESGVASSTVSRALENHPRISAATRKQVQELVKSKEYVPNRSVTSQNDSQREMAVPEILKQQRNVLSFFTWLRNRLRILLWLAACSLI